MTAIEWLVGIFIVCLVMKVIITVVLIVRAIHLEEQCELDREYYTCNE